MEPTPYDAIREAADRRWTFRLLDHLARPELSPDEREKAVAALQAISDYRALPRLEELLIDATRPDDVRESAGDVLRGMEHLCIDVPAESLRRWWAGSDAILRRHALLCMEAWDCGDIVRATASEAGHPLRRAGLGRMEFGFETPADVRLKVAALSDRDPAIRACAADALLTDEPIAAQEALLAAAGDPDPTVVARVMNTLQYYPTLATIRRIGELAAAPEEFVRIEARATLRFLASDFQGWFRRPERVRRWAAPVWDVLTAFLKDEPPEWPAESPRLGCAAAPSAEVFALLADPDAATRDLLECLTADAWGHYSADERIRFRDVILGHPDPLVRRHGSFALMQWGDVEGLCRMLSDPDFGVREDALRSLDHTPPDPAVASLAWAYVERECDPAWRSLTTYARHAAPAEVGDRLAAIVADPSRPESLRDSAIHRLVELRAADAVRSLAPVLAEPPTLTWALHTTLIDAFARLGLTPPDLSHLQGVDHLAVQEALGRFD